MAKLSSTHIYGDLYVDGSIDGKVNKDSAGQQINTTYIKGLSVSGKTITYTKGDGTTGTITTQDTNTTYSAATQSAAGLMSAADKTKLDGIATGANNYSHPNSGVTASSYGPSANASPAHSGTFSVPYITVNAAGHITAASTKTITLPADNNTWRGVQNNLTSTATDQSLSAAQGKILQDNKADKTLLGEDLSSKTISLNDLNLSSGSPKFKVYYCPTDGGGSNITGRPNDSSKQAFNLVIESLRWASTTDYITKQTYTQGSQKIIYVRYCTNGTWTAWEKVYTSGQKPTAADIGAAASSHGTHLTIGTGASNAAAGNHTHNYAGSASAGGAANSVKTNLIIKLNGGSTEGTNLFTFNGGTAKTVNITPSAIGAAASSHGTHLTIGTGASNAAAGNHTHNYAGSASAGGAANSVKTNLIIKLNGGSTEGTNLFTFNGGTAKTVNITASSIGAAASSHGTHLTIGTGASNAAAGNHTHSGYASSSHSHNFLNIKGDNTITSTSNDTTANWGSHGNSVHWYTATGQITDQPSQWGYILNIGKSGEVHQIWMTQASGDMFHRGGNANGWSGSWRKLLDSSNWSSYAAASSHNHTRLTGEVLFPGSGTYTDPWSGTTCCIKGTGNIGCTGGLRANGGVATCGTACGCATSDGATYVGNFRYAQSRGICDLGSNSIPGRIYLRSGQGTAGSGIYIENKVTNGNAYMQYLSPEAGTIALTSHLSDRTRKENIAYVGTEECGFSNKDFYSFIKNNLELATYNLKEEYAATDTHKKLNFIAQDILWDFDKQEESKVGNLIVQAEDAMEEQLSLKYDPEIFTGVIAGALKESINKIETLESEKAKMQAEIDELRADLTELKAIVKGLL